MSCFNIKAFSAECQDFVINFRSFDKDDRILWLEAHSQEEAPFECCPHCGSHHIHQNKIYERRIQDVPFLTGSRTFIRTTVRSWECQECRKVFSEKVPFLHEGTRVTDNLANAIKDILRYTCIKAVSKIFHVCWDTVKAIHMEEIDATLAARRAKQLKDHYRPRFLGVDEFAIHKGHSYATIVMDLETGEVIWAGVGRTIEDFNKFFDEIEIELLEKVEAVAMDMNASFNKVVHDRLPNAEIVYDRYHMEAQYGKNVMGQVRLNNARKELAASKEKGLTKEEKKLLRKEYSGLKGARWMLLQKGKGSQDENGNWISENPKLAEILNKHEDIAVCYALKEEFTDLYALRDTMEATAAWKRWFEAAAASGIEPLTRFAKNKRGRFDGLVAHAAFPIGTGRVEGTNNKIKVLKRQGYGFRDDEYFFSLIRYSTIPKTELLP